MNLKKHFFIVLDTREFGGTRKAISVNQLTKYIPENRASFIIKKIHNMKVDKLTVRVQNMGCVDIYCK